jgi:xylulokinase
MDTRHLALGLDLGTSGLKALVMDGMCHVVASATQPYPLYRPQPGWAEQDPVDWWGAVVAALAALRARGVALERVEAIGLSGQMHGLVLLDVDGEPIGTCHLWSDLRCAAEARTIERRVGRERLRAITGSAANTSATAAKLLWWRRHEPGHPWTAGRIRQHHLVLPKDFLRWRLTRVLATDVSDASGTLLCDLATRTWSQEVLDALGLPADMLPPVYESPVVTGTLSRQVAGQLGLRAGIPVVGGGGDAACAAIGAGLIGGAHDASWGLATLGTAGQFLAVAETPRVDSAGRTQTLCHAVPGRWYVMTAILAGASALSWLAGMLLPGGERTAAVVALLHEAEGEPVGARGLLFVPHLNGVRVPRMDPTAAGAFIGLRPEHTRATLARAVVEGVALALREGLVAARALGMPIERVRLAGPTNRSRLWAQVQADVFGLPVEVGVAEDASALGAALLAGTGTGLIPSLEAGVRRITITTAVYQPDPEASARYAELYAQTCALLPRLRSTFAALDALR